MSELLPCPFCGGEAHMSASSDGYGVECWNRRCIDMQMEQIPTEAEAIAAWNTRAAYEMDGWFYLPKPKQQLFSYTTGLTFDDLSLKVTGAVGVYALTDAVRKWQIEELNQHIVERICDVFKPERTCHIEHPFYGDAPVINGQPRCSECKTEFAVGTFPNYCPNCGARVVE